MLVARTPLVGRGSTPNAVPEEACHSDTRWRCQWRSQAPVQAGAVAVLVFLMLALAFRTFAVLGTSSATIPPRHSPPLPGGAHILQPFLQGGQTHSLDAG